MLQLLRQLFLLRLLLLVQLIYICIFITSNTASLVGTFLYLISIFFDITQAFLHSRLHRIPILVIAPSVGQSTALIQ